MILLILLIFQNFNIFFEDQQLKSYIYGARFAYSYTLVMGAFSECLRLVQVPLLVGHFIVFYDLLYHVLPGLSLLIYGLGLLITLYLKYGLGFGEPNFNNYPKFNTPFDCGYQRVRTSKFGNEVQVYYPISKSGEKTQDVDWLPHGEKSITAMLMATSNWFTVKFSPNILLAYMRFPKIGV